MFGFQRILPTAAVALNRGIASESARSLSVIDKCNFIY